MSTITRTEYVEINGIALATPAWELNDITSLYDVAPVRGEVLEVPFRRGALSARRWQGPKRLMLPITIFGDQDPDGIAYASAREGIMANRNLLVRDVVRPELISWAGTRTLRHHWEDGTIVSGPCQVIPPLQIGAVSPTTLRGSLDVILIEGVLRDETLVDVTSAEVAAAGSDTLDVPNPGSALQDAAVLILTGTATAVTITNLTADPGGDVWLTFGGSLGTITTIDTGEFTADRDGVNVVGLVSDNGFDRWLPLVAGVDNVLEIEPVGGTATLQIQHYPAYL